MSIGFPFRQQQINHSHNNLLTKTDLDLISFHTIFIDMIMDDSQYVACGNSLRGLRRVPTRSLSSRLVWPQQPRRLQKLSEPKRGKSAIF